MKNNCTFARPGVIAAVAALFVLAGCASNGSAPVFDRDGRPSAVAAAKDVYTVKSGDTLYSISREVGMDRRELIALNNIENPNQISVGRVLKIKPQAVQGGATTAPVVSDVVVAKPIGNDQIVEKRPLGNNTDTVKREPKAGKEAYSDQALAKAQNQDQPKGSEVAAAAPKTDAKSDAKPGAEAAALTGDEIAWIWPANGKTVATFSEGGSKGLDIAGKAGDPVIASADGKVVYSGTGLRGYGKLVILKHNNTYLSAYAHSQTILVKEGQTVSKGQKIAEMGNSDADQVKLHFEVRRQGKPVDPLKYLPAR
ncbi:MAG: peptidoglycan DD-metalloendopeptidase family protein [Betaproteobacteria bacterium]